MPLPLATSEVRERVTYSCERLKQVSLLKACFKNVILGRLPWHPGNRAFMLVHEMCGQCGLNALILPFCLMNFSPNPSNLPQLNFLIWILEQVLCFCSCNMNNLRAVAFNLFWFIKLQLFFSSFADPVRNLTDAHCCIACFNYFSEFFWDP